MDVSTVSEYLLGIDVITAQNYLLDSNINLLSKLKDPGDRKKWFRKLKQVVTNSLDNRGDKGPLTIGELKAKISRAISGR